MGFLEEGASSGKKLKHQVQRNQVLSFLKYGGARRNLLLQKSKKLEDRTTSGTN
jgi:hypothetical protein